MTPFAEIDVSAWPIDAVEPLGTKPKHWVTDPFTGMPWLLKERTYNRRADGTRYPKGDDWAERIGTEVANELGLPVAHTEFAYATAGGDVTYGVISRMVLAPGESLVHGNELLAEIGVSGRSPHDRAGYTLSAVGEVLEAVSAPSQEPPGFSAWDWFAGYLVLDALIGNTDRHQENWAVVANGRRRLAPSFDHASSLGFQLDDENRWRRLTTSDAQWTPAAYADRARTKFEEDPHPVDMAAKALAMASEPARAHWIRAAQALRGFKEIVDRVPPARMSDPARAFALAVLARNRSQLLSHPLCSVSP